MKILNNNNNCYLNVIIHILLNNKNTKDIIKDYFIIQNDVICPNKLLNLIKNKIDTSRQNDCQETLIHLIEVIPKLNELIEGKIENSFICLNCNDKRKIIDPFITLNLCKESLQASVNELTKKEENYLDCDNCKARTKTIKKSDIIKLNNIVLMLNTLKIKIEINSSFTYNQFKYKLTGIIKHSGNMNFGHYYYIDPINLIEYSDTTITKINNYNGNDIYMLIYTI